MRQRAIVPATAVELAKAKAISNVSKVVRIGDNAEIYYNKRGRLTIRKVGRSGGLNAKAKELKACKGKGMACVRGVLPKGKKTKAA